MVEKKAKKTVGVAKTPTSRPQKTRDARTAKRFLEELSWLLQSYENLDFKVISEPQKSESFASKSLTSNVSENGNIHFLVGTLPIIFNNPRYFPANEDIVEFASGALGLSIPRWEKRSRYELIGLIVCETAKLDNHRLHRLVGALTKVTEEDPGAKEIMNSRKENSLSWNELIQVLTSQEQS